MSTSQKTQRRVLIIVENLPVPFDRRVWAEAQALTQAGYGVSVICPNKMQQAEHEILAGVSIYRYPPPADGVGIGGYIKEYLYSLLAAFRLSLRVKKQEGFDVVQICNPPDILFLIALYHKLLSKTRVVFDHHDLSPELFALRFDPQKRSLVYRLLLWFERRTFRTADIVLSTNESFKEMAIKRGGKSAEDVYVVRNGPNLKKFYPREPRPELKLGRQYLVCYVGMMAAQDGLDYLIKAADHVINRLDRKDVTFVLIGDGDVLPDIKRLAQDLGLSDHVVFTGRINDDEMLSTYLSTADVCVAPDPWNEVNDRSTLIKLAEYMAIGKPIVSFNLTESRRTAGEAALYAEGNDWIDFGNKIVQLLDSPEERFRMGQYGSDRVRSCLSWDHSVRHLLAAYDRLFAKGSNSSANHS